MSSGPSDENVEQTKRRIRTLVSEITDLSKSEAKAGEYYPAVLQRIIAALAAEGGAVWLLDPDGAMRLAHQIQMDPMLMQADQPESMQHGRLLGRLMAQGRAELVPPFSGSGDAEGEGNPTPHLLVTAPLVSNKQTVGLLEILQRANSHAEAQRGYLRFLEHMTKLIGDWLQSHTLQQVSTRQEMWQQADQFARLVHDSLDLRDTSYTIANEGRRLIECDRVSVALLKGNKSKVIAISGQDSIENRSNIVQALNQLSTRVMRSGEPLWYDGNTEDLPPQLEEAIEDYVDLSHGRTITVLPIRQPEKTIEGDVLAARNETNESRQRRKIIGALIVEQIETQLSRSMLEGRVDLVYEHACRAMSNSLNHSNIIFMPVWRFLDRCLWMFRGSALPKTIAILSAIAIGILALFLVQIDFKLKGNGQIKPEVEEHVYAHANGVVEEVLVKHGDKVHKDQVLVVMKDDDLIREMKGVEDQLSLTNVKLQNLLSSSKSPGGGSGNNQEPYKVEREIIEAELTQKALQSQIALLEVKEQKMKRLSPIDGTVLDWDIERVLNRRPVVMGQKLMTIANKDQDWELEVLLPEKKMRYLERAFAAEREKNPNAEGGASLPVTFIIASDRNEYQGKLYWVGVAGRADLDPEEGPVVKLRCVPDEEAMKAFSRYPGARVIARVKAGRASAAFVWFHEIVEWLRANVWF
jgi:hypothetical protein